MADVVAATLMGEAASFEGADLSTKLKLKSASFPIRTIEVRDPITDAIRSGVKLETVISIRITSMAKITAPIGAPNIAEIAPAAPQPIKSALFFAFRCIKRPTLEPMAEPVTTMGASNPTDPPKPTVRVEVMIRL